MKYTRYGPILATRRPLSCAFLNAMEDFLTAIPAEEPYRRYGPFVNGQSPAIGESFVNGVEDFLSRLSCSERYLRWGPFFGGIGHGTFIQLFNHIEDFLVTLDTANPEQFDRNWQSVQPLGSRVPLAWIHRKDGRVIDNPDYIARPEPAQYEQALMGYELCEKASK